MVVALNHPNSTASSTPAVLLMLAEINLYLSLSFFFDKKSNHTVIYSFVSPRAVQIITPRPARRLALAAQAANRFETQPNHAIPLGPLQHSGPLSGQRAYKGDDRLDGPSPA
jgi:hypothetical protein